MMIPWVDREREQAMATAAKYLYGRKVRPGRIVRVRAAIAWDEISTVATAIIIGVEDRGEHHRVASWAGNTTIYVTRGTVRDFWLLEGQRLYAYFQDATDGDILYLESYGFEDDMGEQMYWPG